MDKKCGKLFELERNAGKWSELIRNEGSQLWKKNAGKVFAIDLRDVCLYGRQQHRVQCGHAAHASKPGGGFLSELPGALYWKMTKSGLKKEKCFDFTIESSIDF